MRFSWIRFAPQLVAARRQTSGRTLAGWGTTRAVCGRLPFLFATIAVLVSSFAGTSAGAEKPLLIYAGAGFRLPIEDAAQAFTERTGIEIETTFAGSGCLLAQAELAGRGDLFIPGETHYLEQARARELAGEMVPLAYLRPVIAVAKGNPHRIEGLADLARPGLEVGLGDAQSVAVGLAAERWMGAMLDPETITRIHGNVRTRAINVNELGSQLSLGALQAVIVWDATIPLFSQIEAVPCTSPLEARTMISGSVLSFSRCREDATAFLRFLAGEEGASLFRKHGYEPAGIAAAAAGAPFGAGLSSADSR